MSASKIGSQKVLFKRKAEMQHWEFLDFFIPPLQKKKKEEKKAVCLLLIDSQRVCLMTHCSWNPCFAHT